MKTIDIDLLTRVEGNGGVSVTIDGNVVTDVKFKIYEGPRLIEKMTVGRTPEEDVSLTPRICAICSVSHKLAAIRAMEDALSVEVSPEVQLYRELMHMGEMIESHSLHTFYLALPDYLGFPNAIAMAADHDLEVKIALEMKEFANFIMQTLSGRPIHGENPKIGGFGRYPSKEELLWIKSRAIQFMPFVHKTVTLFCEIDYPDSPEEETLYACCDPGNKEYGFWGERILLSNGTTIEKENYKNLTNEFVVSHSFAKHSRYDGKPYSVGALARVNNLGERLEGKAGEFYKKYFNPRWKTNPLFHNAAQALEICYCFERTPVLIDAILKRSDRPPLVDYSSEKGKGTGLVEAPRGLLIHSYEIADGLVTHTDIVTPTAQNADDIERYCQIGAQKLLNEGNENLIVARMEQVVRAFDPCISCSVHMAEIKKAPRGDWKNRLEGLIQAETPIYIGLGKRNRSDDGAGIELARRLQTKKKEFVLTETETGEIQGLERISPSRPLIFIDTVDFKEKPGKITVIPLTYLLNSGSLSHQFQPFLAVQKNPQQLKNSYILAIQPKSIAEGTEMSTPVMNAVEKLSKYLAIEQK
jgi:sulfhydrogenase subunit alpha